MKVVKREELKEKIDHLSEEKLGIAEKIFAELSTDESESDSGKYSPQKINITPFSSNIFEPDEWGDSRISKLIQDKDFLEIKKLYTIKDKISNAGLLKQIAIQMTNYKEMDLSRDSALSVYSEAKFQLRLLGEDITEVVESYNFDLE